MSSKIIHWPILKAIVKYNTQFIKYTTLFIKYTYQLKRIKYWLKNTTHLFIKNHLLCHSIQTFIISYTNQFIKNNVTNRRVFTSAKKPVQSKMPLLPVKLSLLNDRIVSCSGKIAQFVNQNGKIASNYKSGNFAIKQVAKSSVITHFCKNSFLEYS